MSPNHSGISMTTVRSTANETRGCLDPQKETASGGTESNEGTWRRAYFFRVDETSWSLCDNWGHRRLHVFERQASHGTAWISSMIMNLTVVLYNEGQAGIIDLIVHPLCNNFFFLWSQFVPLPRVYGLQESIHLSPVHASRVDLADWVAIPVTR